MGLTVILQNEFGAPLLRVFDPKNLLHRMLPSNEDSSFPMLRFVDWYGDTVFNRLQLPELLEEVGRLSSRAGTHEEKALVNEILDLTAQAQRAPHLYVKFEGD